jgi:hypothetical protein
MRVIWDAVDVRAGRIVKKPGTVGKGTLIAYRVAHPGATYALVSLDDGCITDLGMSLSQTADTLNENGDVPWECLTPAEQQL